MTAGLIAMRLAGTGRPAWGRFVIMDGNRAPDFDPAFGGQLVELLRWRRDVRRFRSDPVDRRLVDEFIAAAQLAPSVGYSQPWRFVLVESPAAREAVRSNFQVANGQALSDYSGDRAAAYARLKLEGLDRAPVQIAVFTDTGTGAGHGLGRRTMPQTLDYSTVMAIHTFWLVARAAGVGVGWVSILDPERICVDLDVPDDWKFTAYLCVGYPEHASQTPELARLGWQQAIPEPHIALRR